MALLWKCFVILTFSLGAFAKEPDPKSLIQFKKEKIQIGSKTLNVEVAETEEQQEQGLMYRKSLGADDGMIFIFPTEKRLYFWMKNTFVDLSIGYFDAHGTLGDVHEMKATSLMDVNPVTYPSVDPAKYALEMNKGWFAKNKIKKGAKIKFLDSGRQ